MFDWQAHKSELKQLQGQLDQAYNDLSELQYSTDQDKAALEEQVQAAQERVQVRLCRHGSAATHTCPTLLPQLLRMQMHTLRGLCS